MRCPVSAVCCVGLFGSPGTIRATRLIACSVASYNANLNDFAPDAKLARHNWLANGTNVIARESELLSRSNFQRSGYPPDVRITDGSESDQSQK